MGEERIFQASRNSSTAYEKHIMNLKTKLEKFKETQSTTPQTSSQATELKNLSEVSRLQKETRPIPKIVINKQTKTVSQIDPSCNATPEHAIKPPPSTQQS